MISWLISLLNPLEAIGKQLNHAYALKLTAQNDAERIDADMVIARLEAQQAVLIAEQGSWVTRWIRPALAVPVVAYWWKLIIWDTLLGYGTTPYPGDHVAWFVTLIPGAYFLVRPFEKRR